MFALSYLIILIITASNIKSDIEEVEKLEPYHSGYFYEDCIFNNPFLEDLSEIKTDICKLQNKTDVIIERINDKSDIYLKMIVLVLSFFGTILSFIGYKEE